MFSVAGDVKLEAVYVEVVPQVVLYEHVLAVGNADIFKRIGESGANRGDMEMMMDMTASKGAADRTG